MLSKLFNPNRLSTGESSTSGTLLTNWKKIVLPAIGAPFSMRSVLAACRLCQQSSAAELRLVYVIEVPRSVALQASMPAEEDMAEDALGAAVAASQTFGVRAHTEVLHVREAAEGIAKYVTQQGADLVVLGTRADSLRGLPLELCRDLYERIPCEVILNYVGTES
jgi:nucleotide-binding universal stress UspA family protein